MTKSETRAALLAYLRAHGVECHEDGDRLAVREEFDDRTVAWTTIPAAMWAVREWLGY